MVAPKAPVVATVSPASASKPVQLTIDEAARTEKAAPAEGPRIIGVVVSRVTSRPFSDEGEKVTQHFYEHGRSWSILEGYLTVYDESDNQIATYPFLSHQSIHVFAVFENGDE